MSVLPPEFVKACALKKGAPEISLEVLLLAIEGWSIKKIAQEKSLKEAAVRKRLGIVYEKFEVPGQGPGKLARLEQMLLSEYRAEERQQVSTGPLLRYGSWENAPDLTAFFGRQSELQDLHKWVVDDRCRLVAIVGMVGIGKTTLAVKLAQEVQNQFDGVIWRSLYYPVPLEQLIADIMTVLSPDSPADQALDLPSQLTQLMDCLQKTRCLLVLDGITTIQESGDFAGSYKEDYKAYGEFFRRLAAEKHQSCLIVTSQDKPREMAQAESKTLPVQTLTLEDLDEEAARQILSLKNLSGQQEWSELIHLYRGNPLALKIVAATIQELFGGDVASYIQQSLTFVLRDIRALLEEQFNRLKPIEQAIVYWLAIAKTSVHLSQLQDWFSFAVPVLPATLQDALESLNERSLLEQSVEGFTLQPTVMEYATDRLGSAIYDEIYHIVTSDGPEALRSIADYENRTKPASNPLKLLASYSVESLYTHQSAYINDSTHSPQRLSITLLDQVKALLRHPHHQQILETRRQNMKDQPSSETGYFAKNLDFILNAVRTSKAP